MANDPRPTWQLLLEAAEQLTRRGTPVFARAELVAEVRGLDPTREDGTIGPTIQGMTANAPGGPRSACGEVFWKVERGRYRLLATAPSAVPANEPIVRPAADLPQVLRVLAAAPEPAPGGRRIGLVGCVKEKALVPCAARDLYVSTLFAGRRAFVERTCASWWILSAEHGLVHPTDVLGPYDTALKDASRAARRSWSGTVLDAIAQRIAPSPGDVFEIHAGAEYRDFGLVAGLLRQGCVVENPTEGLGIGRQLAFYAAARSSR